MIDLLKEMEMIVMSGTRLDIGYHLDETLDADTQEELMDHFRNAETDDIEATLDEFGNDFSEEEVRLMRIKFLSEVANYL